MESWRWRALASVGVLALVWAFAGCAGREFAPKRATLYYHPELPAADRAVEAARAAGKDKECPEDFKAAERMKEEAYDIYLSCRTAEGIARANEAAARANGLCGPKAAPPPPPPPAPIAEPAPPPPPPPPAAPTVNLSANPPSVDAGKCSTLTWSSENATEGSIDQGIGSVSPSGSREVCPAATTQYQLTATGPGGSRAATTTVTVNPPPPPPPPPAAPRVVDRLVLHINFDTNKSVIRPADVPELEKAVEFVKKYPDSKISVEGYTDSRGTDKYNLGLSERRAQAVKKYLEDKGGVSAGRITALGKGKADPIGDNKTEKGRFENRRVEVLVLEQ